MKYPQRKKKGKAPKGELDISERNSKMYWQSGDDEFLDKRKGKTFSLPKSSKKKGGV